MPQEQEGTRQDQRTLSVGDAAETITGLLSKREPERRETRKPGAREPDERTETRTEDEDAHAARSADEGTEVPEQDTEGETEQAPDDAEDAQTASDDAEPEPERKHRVRVDGQDLEVSYDELLAGYSRTSDYTRKTQAIAEHRKALETEAARVRETRSRYDAELAKAEDALVAMQPVEPNWDEIRKTTPDQYPALFTDWQRYQAALGAVREKRQRLAEEQMVDDAERHRGFVRDQTDRLLKAVPEWNDTGKRGQEFERLTKAAKEYGFSDDEINQIVDSRAILVLRDATRYREIVAGTRKIKDKVSQTGTGSIRPAKPGTPKTGAPPAVLTNAARRLAKSGDVEDAAEVLTHILRPRKPAR